MAENDNTLTDEDVKEIMDAQNRSEDPHGDMEAPEPLPHEEFADNDPDPLINPDADDKFDDLNDDDNANEDDDLDGE